MVNVTPRVGCPYLQGRTSDTFNEGFAFVGRNLAINNASVAGKMYISRISAKDSVEQYGMYINISTAGYTTLGTNSAASPNIPSFEIATGGAGIYAGSVIIDSASNIQLESAGANITADSPITLTYAAADEKLRLAENGSNYATFSVAGDGYLTIASVGTDADLELASGTDGDIILDATSQVKLESAGGNVTVDNTLESTVAAGGSVLKFVATSDSPTVVFGNGGPTNPSYVMSTAPTGYMEVDVGGTPYYMPYWA